MIFLTRQEKYIVVFLIIGAICGAGYSYYKRSRPPIEIRFKEPIPENHALTKELDSLLKETKSVNINRASLEELIKLKGIGPALAHRIIEYRRENGLFKDKRDVQNVTGIGPKKFNAMKDHIQIE